eukprot:scaffold15515_cov117-Cylindrotheca_fusiformis.AAC.5
MSWLDAASILPNCDDSFSFSMASSQKAHFSRDQTCCISSRFGAWRMIVAEKYQQRNHDSHSDLNPVSFLDTPGVAELHVLSRNQDFTFSQDRSMPPSSFLIPTLTI